MKKKQALMLSLILLFIFSIVLNAQIKSKIEQVAGKAVKTKIWQGREIQFVEREIAVKVILSATKTEISDLIKTIGGRVINSFDERGWGLIELPVDKDEILVINDLLKLPFVSAAEPNMVTSADIEPNDPYFNGTSPATYPYQWALKNTGQTPPTGTNDADIDAPEAWNITTGNSDVILAILDSGIPMLNGSLSHPDLDDSNKIILGQDCVGDGEGVRDRLGHGTHVAGIAAAESNNGIGVSGVAWNSKILVIQVFDEYGSGSYSAFYNGVVYAVDYQRNNPGKKVVINFSGGGSASQLALDAVIYANTYGVPIVASAGNNYGGTVKYPAAYSSSYSNVIAVSATDATDTFAPYSNLGSQVCVSAPGGYGGTSDADDIYSTTPNYTFNFGEWYGITQNYGYMAGTSMAAPHVTGIAGLLLSVNANLTPAQIRNIIQQSAEDKGTIGFDNYYGYGRVNAYKAVKYTLENYGGNLAQSLTIPVGETWAFAEGVTITIQPGASIIVNGTLTATGTSANNIMFDRSGTTGTWNGIVFNSGSSGSVEYCNISHATTGITCSYTLPMIRYNAIANNATGIYVSNVGTPSNEISYNTIQSNTYQGISLYYASPKIYSNTISGNAYYGISCRYYSSPYLYGNTITGHPSSALSCYYYSSAKLVPWNAYGYYWGRGNNKIKNNTGTGITASYWSNLFLGSSPYGGYNSICNNTGYELSAYYGCTVTAQLNWWGAYPPNVNEFYPYQSTIDYTNALQTDPNPDPEQGMVRGPNGISNSSTINSAKSDLDKAYSLQSEGKFDEAIAVYDSYINANPTDSKSAYALVRIDECYKLSGKEGAVTYLDNTIKTKANKNNELDAVSLELKNQYLIQDKRFEEAVNNLNKLAETYNTNKEVEKHSLFNAGYVYLKYLNDYKNATDKFAELAAKYPDDDLVLESNYLLGEVDANSNQQAASPQIAQSNLPMPTEYALGQNYPNPFNPVTTITYQLPKSGSVTLKIFDILGNEVKTLVNENKEMGRYTVQFDASSLASGMYVYQLRVNDYTSTKKMLLLK